MLYCVHGIARYSCNGYMFIALHGYITAVSLSYQMLESVNEQTVFPLQRNLHGILPCKWLRLGIFHLVLYKDAYSKVEAEAEEVLW